MYRRDRINERDVPESQHTIFIRGLPGHIETTDLSAFFAKEGTCSFDFVKVSPDRTKLYVAVRFDSKTVAREVMEKYSNGQILTYDVEMSWFRDIRRYLAHCAKQGVRPSRFSDRRRFDNRGGGGRRSRSRSYTRSPERGPGEEVENKSMSRSVTRSPSRRSRSYSGERSPLRSKSFSSGRSSVHSEKSLDYSDIVKKERELSPSPPPKKVKRKKERKDRKKRKHVSPGSPARNNAQDGSDMEGSEGEITSPPAKYANAMVNQQQQNSQMGGGSLGQLPVGVQAPMTITMSKPIGPTQPAESQPAPVFQPFAHRQIPIGSLATNQQQQQQMQQQQQQQASVYDVHAPSNYHQEQQRQNVQIHHQQQQQQPDSSSGVSQNKFRQTFKVELDSNAAPLPKFKPVMADSAHPGIVYQQINGNKMIKEEILTSTKRAHIDTTPPPPAAIRNVKAAYNNEMVCSSPVRESGPLGNNIFKDIQRQILQDVRYKASQQEMDDENLGGLRLSMLSKQRMTDDMREEKISKLPIELRERVNKKKRQLELSYRHDCETFGLVTRKLVEKDRTLEERLKIALLETMKDLEGETMKQLDEFLEELSFICT